MEVAHRLVLDSMLSARAGDNDQIEDLRADVCLRKCFHGHRGSSGLGKRLSVEILAQ